MPLIPGLLPDPQVLQVGLIPHVQVPQGPLPGLRFLDLQVGLWMRFGGRVGAIFFLLPNDPAAGRFLALKSTL